MRVIACICGTKDLALMSNALNIFIFKVIFHTVFVIIFVRNDAVYFLRQCYGLIFFSQRYGYRFPIPLPLIFFFTIAEVLFICVVHKRWPNKIV